MVVANDDDWAPASEAQAQTHKHADIHTLYA